MRRWETGVSLPTPEIGKKLADLFNIDLAELLDPADHSSCLLADLRMPTGLSQRDATRALDWPLARLVRSELGERALKPSEQHALADLYHLDPKLVADAAKRTHAKNRANRAATTTASPQKKLSGLLQQITEDGEPVFLGSHHKPEAVLLTITDYQRLTRNDPT